MGQTNDIIKQIIRLEQQPVIEHDLERIGRMVDERIKELNLENMLATRDSIRHMKRVRAELNKEFNDFEEQRKLISRLVSKPYDDMNEIYKVQIREKYESAVDILKEKITAHEDFVKKEKELEVEVYFDELCATENIDFITFEQAEINVTLSASMKSLKEAAAEFVDRVKSDLELIATQEHEEEILVEYHKDLNVSKAIKDVTERMAAIEQERQRLIEQEKRRRHNILTTECNMKYDDFLKAYTGESEEYTLDVDFVAKSTTEDFNAKVQEIKDAIARDKAVEKAEQVAKKGLQAPTVAQSVPDPQPQQEKAPQLLTAQFAVQGTQKQLEGLRDYMIENKIKYKNI